MSGKVPITLRGAEQLREELKRLKTVERPSVIAAIAEARSHGDLSENAEYDAAKERQGFVEGRIAEVEGKLGNAQIIDPRALDADGRVVFGATVELEDMDEEKTVTYQVVGDDEADLKQGKISLNSPVARSLIGKFAGDVVEVQTPGGRRSPAPSTGPLLHGSAMAASRAPRSCSSPFVNRLTSVTLLSEASAIHAANPVEVPLSFGARNRSRKRCASVWKTPNGSQFRPTSASSFCSQALRASGFFSTRFAIRRGEHRSGSDSGSVGGAGACGAGFGVRSL